MDLSKWFKKILYDSCSRISSPVISREPRIRAVAVEEILDRDNFSPLAEKIASKKKRL